MDVNAIVEQQIKATMMKAEYLCIILICSVVLYVCMYVCNIDVIFGMLNKILGFGSCILWISNLETEHQTSDFGSAVG